MNFGLDKKDQTQEKKEEKVGENKLSFGSLTGGVFGGGDKKGDLTGNKEQSSLFSFGGDQSKKEPSFGNIDNKASTENKTAISFGGERFS